MLTLALPTTSYGYNTASPAYVQFAPGVVPGAKLVPLINSGETIFGDTFEGIPDGIGVVPIDDDHVDLYVAHEQSHVPFPIGVVVGGVTQTGTADFQDSSVTRLRVQLSTRSIVDMDIALSPDEGLIRFCSAFMAGPEHGFADYTFLVNEESDDNIPVPAGAVYGSDPAMAPLREAGYTVWLDTATEDLNVVPGMGRHNHENAVVVPGGWDDVAVLSGDDTFNAPASQLYLYTADDADAFKADEGALWAFRVTATDDGSVDPTNPFNGANDYGEISVGETWSGEFIPVDPATARGDLATTHPQAGLENWSNDDNAFQFIRVEDIAYDPDNPRVVYFADTGEPRALTDAQWVALNPLNVANGRLHRGPSGTVGNFGSGRIFRMVLNADDPTIVDEFWVFLEATSIGMRNPDNLAVGRKSVMVQEDASNAKVWRYSFVKNQWTHIATVTQPTAETSGIVDVSQWFGGGWWALDVQSHVAKTVDPGPYFWPDGPDANTDPDPYQKRREDGQLLLMFIPSS
ncbi:MAG TPA: alkaline phosphatase PhoX [Candidatus Binatia bacterium]|nr:alkaline phosphatase PhoX [Candidatus Binatia bacterium]